MKTFSRPILSLVLAACLLVPALAHANKGGAAKQQPSSAFITAKYAKQLVGQRATKDFGHFGKGWKVRLQPGTTKNGAAFSAKVNWGKGPHIMIGVPTVTGVVNMSKAPNAPKGPARVTVLTPKGGWGGTP